MICNMSNPQFFLPFTRKILKRRGAILSCVNAKIVCGDGKNHIKQNKKYYDESVQRLQNKEYVEKLVSYGYNVPERYR